MGFFFGTYKWAEVTGKALLTFVGHRGNFLGLHWCVFSEEFLNINVEYGPSDHGH